MPRMPQWLGDTIEKVFSGMVVRCTACNRQAQSTKGKFWAEWKEEAFYLTGRARSIQAIRKVLTDRGIPMKNIFTEPYWADGKKGL